MAGKNNSSMMSGRQFWSSHFLAPLIAFLFVAALFERYPIDLRLADILFAWEGDAWNLRNHWLTYEVLHHYGKLSLVGIGLATLVLAVASIWHTVLRPYRKSLIYLLTSMTVIPLTFALAKHFSHVPCPWSLLNYGATEIYQHSLNYPLGAGGSGHCFPSGHASGGFALLAMYFAAYPHSNGGAWRFLLPGLLIGAIFGFSQQLRGAHFLSHDLWTAFFSWVMALLLYRLFDAWPGKA